MAKKRTLFKSKVRYLGGLPVGQPGQECRLEISTEGLALSRGGLRGKWRYDISLADIRAARIETGEKVTLKRVLLVGILAPLWKKKEKLLLVSYGSEGFTSDLILGKLKIEAAQQAILKARAF
jgi:hypothetical protein